MSEFYIIFKKNIIRIEWFVNFLQLSRIYLLIQSGDYFLFVKV